MNDPCKKCQICKSEDLSLRYPVTDTNQDVPGSWNILVCNNCGTGVLCPFPDAKKVASYYDEIFYTKEGSRFRGWVESLRTFLGALRGGALNALAPQKGRLLDFGSGAGHFVAAQKMKGWDAHSIDPYSHISADADQCKLNDEGFKLLYPDEYFDVITLWYVIEHLRNPINAVAELARVLKPGGILVLAQQDFGSVQAGIFGANWLYLDPPRHLWQFTADSIAQLGHSQGFEVIHRSWASLEMGPFCILQSTLNMLLGNQNDLFRFLRDRKLSETDNNNVKPKRLTQITASLLLVPLLGPLSLIIYFILLTFRSGDVVSVYFRKESKFDSPG